jgi:hypothetical protein
LIVLLVSGIVSGIAGNWFGQGWIWAAIALLVGISFAMTPLAIAYLNPIRRALGQRTREVKATEPDPTPLPIDQVLVLTQSRRPEMTLLIGGGGLLVILWLMVFKPF